MIGIKCSGCIFVVFSILNYGLALSYQCYTCHGEYCNDPFNKDKATVTTCSSSMNSRLIDTSVDVANEDIIQANNKSADITLDDWNNFEWKLKSKFSALFGTSTPTEYVCVKSTYYNNVHQINMTVRRCMPKNIKNTDACTTMTNIITAGFGTVQKCSACETDLCNSSVNLKVCIVTVFAITLLKSLF